jgi:Ca-activated chloride channel family protein
MNFFFAYPWVLLLLVLPIILAWWECTREGHPIRLPFDHASPRNHRPWLSFLVTLANLLPALLVAVAILALAGPRRFAPPKNERIMTNIQFCLDLSGSMRMPMQPPMGSTIKKAKATDSKRLGYNGSYSRLDGATDSINDFIAVRKDDAYGLTVFGNEFLHWMPLTKDTNAIAMATPFIGRAENVLPQWFGGTSIGKALLGCRDELIKRPAGDRMIILVSDGMSADLGGGEDSKIASTLAEAKISVYLILIGGDAAPAEMYTIANQTGGGVYASNNAAGLKEIFQKIDKMQKVKFKQSAPMAIDWYEPLAIAGLVLAALQALALLGLRYTPW